MRAVCAAFLTTGCQLVFPFEGPPSDAAVDAPPDAAVEHNVAFVTGGVFPGTFGGLAAADQQCQKAAELAGLPDNTYVAWLSDTNTNAVDRLAGARGWVRSDGQPVADRASSLTAVGPLAPLLLNEDGQNVLSSVQNVWTGTDGGGAKHFQRCDDWTSPTAVGVFGTLERGGSLFTATNAFPCTESMRFYCFGTRYSNPLELPAVEATTSVFFVSDSLWTPDDPVEADRRCAAEAANVSLPGSYRAVLTRDGKTLADLFDVSTMYSRIDGVPLGALLTGASNTYPLLTASKQVVTVGSVWTGGLSTGTLATTCNDWSGSGSGAEGLAYDVGATSFNFNISPCNHSAHVYCARYE